MRDESPRYTVLNKAANAIRSRESEYGPPAACFGRTTAMWNAALDTKLKHPLSAADVAILLALLKLARLSETPDHADSQVDLAGYAALMSEVV